MSRKLTLLSSVLLCCGAMTAVAQNVNKIDAPQMLRNGGVRTEIRIPDIAGYKALKGDFHLHTIFSDGSVMPWVRVAEAWSNGLDVIAITDHIEYRPNADILNADHNKSYELARSEADKLGIHLIKATELTADKPQGGHINALFISDANAMERPKGSPDLTQAVDAAIAQGAYLIWNHPGWAIDTCKMFPLNQKWIAEGKIRSVEVFNEKEYYPPAATWVGQYNLAPTANTDAHTSYLMTYADGVTPPYNIILAKTNTMNDIKEAMFAGRMIAVFNGQAMAKPELLKALFEACTSVSRLPNGKWKITNVSDIPFVIRSKELSCVLQGGQSYQFKAGKNFDVEVANLHVDQANNLRVCLKIL